MATEITSGGYSVHDGRHHYMVAIDTVMQGEHMIRAIFSEIAQEVAKKFVEEHYAEIAALLDPQAIANLSIAEGAAAIRETLEKKMPDKVLEVVRTEREVWQRGIFGGSTRIR